MQKLGKEIYIHSYDFWSLEALQQSGPSIGEQTLGTLEYRINVQVVINVQVGYFLQNNKRTGLNKRTGGNLENKIFNTHRAVLFLPV